MIDTQMAQLRRGSGEAPAPAAAAAPSASASSARGEKRYQISGYGISTGPFGVRRFDIDQLYQAKPPPPPRRSVTGEYVKQPKLVETNPAVDSIYGSLVEKYPSLGPIPPDRITPATFARSGAQSARRARRDSNDSSERGGAGGGSQSARRREREESPPRLTDEEAVQAFADAEKLPPFKRVKARMELLRNQPSLQEWIANRAYKHKQAAHAALQVDYLQRNADPANFTPGAAEKKEEQRKREIAARDKRTAHAQRVAKQRGQGSLSSEVLTNARAWGRHRALIRGFAAIAHAKNEARTRRWATLVTLANATVHMRNVAKLSKLVKRIQTTSRVISAVRTVQRRFRARRIAKEGNLQISQVMMIQRLARAFLFRIRRRIYGSAVTTVVTFLRGCERLSPMEMALHRFMRSVRVMQRFMKGYTAVTQGKLVLLTLQWKRLETAKIVELHSKRGGKAGGGADAASKSVAVSSSSSRLEVDKKGRVVRGQYAGTPEEMLDVPLPHVPEEARTRVLKKLLSEMRRAHLQEQIMWDQKVLLRAEQHPALFGGSKGVRRLAVIQHELQKDQAQGKSTTQKYDSVFAIFDNMMASSAVEDEPTGGRRSKSPASHRSKSPADGDSFKDSFASAKPHAKPGLSAKAAKSSMTAKLKKLSSSLAEQRSALDEIRRSIPRPFQRILVPWDQLKVALEAEYDRCKKEGALEMRPIRGLPARGITRQSTTSRSLVEPI